MPWRVALRTDSTKTRYAVVARSRCSLGCPSGVEGSITHSASHSSPQIFVTASWAAISQGKLSSSGG
ncbi:hypothetical protein [Stieleria sp. JC731]|uniref:hypothetical protein n=1 Tax=Stieleria sp. JC731 TaxID=2894195 RepID=UPI003965715F